MIPLPLFSGDVLDSQISDDDISAGRRWRETSHMTHIKSLYKFIWKGDIWLKIYFKIKFNKTFLYSLRKGVPFAFHPEIEDFNTRLMYDSDCDKVKL